MNFLWTNSVSQGGGGGGGGLRYERYYSDGRTTIIQGLEIFLMSWDTSLLTYIQPGILLPILN